MKLQFKHQKFQADAAKAVVGMFSLDSHISPPTYMMDRGITLQQNFNDDEFFTGWRNEPLVRS